MSLPHNPLVSLIMPAWQPEPSWLEGAVASALDQRDCRLELIVVDDGSPMPVAELLSAIQDPRLHVLRIEHAGASVARNAGITASRGAVLRFIDCDDVLEPTSTARLLKMMEGRTDLVTYGGTVFCDEHLRPLYTMGCTLQGPALVPCLLGRFHVMQPALLYPRRVVLATGGWDGSIRVAEDWDFVLRALEHAKVRGDRTPVYYYRRHRYSNAADLNAAWHEGVRRMLAGYFQRHPEARSPRLERRLHAKLEFTAADQTSGGRPWRTRRFWRAGLADPGAALITVREALTRRHHTPLHLLGAAVPAPLRRWLRWGSRQLARRWGPCQDKPPGPARARPAGSAGPEPRSDLS